MKKLILGLIGLIILSMGIYSCSKENFSTQKNTTSTLKTASILFPKLNETQIDDIGVKHNDILTSLYNSYSGQNRNVFFNEAVDDLSKLNHAVFSDFYSLTSQSERINSYTQTATQIESSLLTGNAKIDGYSVLLTKLLNESSNYATVESSINGLVTMAKTDASLSITEYNSVRSMLAVAKNSTYFWMPSDIGGSGRGAIVLNVTFKDEPDQKVNWKKVVEFDAIGAAVGGVKWSFAAAFGGPAGVGAYIGAVVGEAGAASVYGAMSRCCGGRHSGTIDNLLP
jgi:hypothetical protein